MNKKIFISIFLVLAAALTSPAFAQSRDNDDEVVKIDQMNANNFRYGQVLVKFHDFSDIKINKADYRSFVSQTRGLSINDVLAEYDIDSIEQVLPNYQIPKELRSSKSYGGKDVQERDLSQLHLIVLKPTSTKSEYELIEELRDLEEVEFAEPNFICYALGNPSTETFPTNGIDNKKSNNSAGAKTAPAFNDPMYSMQWGIPACGIDQLLGAPKIHQDWRPIIAFLDTGCDIEHPDLAANIWTNTLEAGGANNVDDDGNGFKDDLHGWDFVNQTGNIHDFNSHGTHCAGIAAAVGNNGIGITGACPDAYIMPITVMQSDGTGDVATIIKGVNYAAQNGADIISMSIGTYAYSFALEQALAQAYQTAVLVAAAGNDTRSIEKIMHPCNFFNPIIPMFPAAFTFVLGVQSGSNGVDCFSNIDLTGPSYSYFDEEKLYNYELTAPGVGIWSSVPNGQYRSYNGTSMACPLVAGSIASLLQRRDYLTKEILFGDLINYSQEFQPVNFWAVYNGDSIAPAILQMVAVEINDTLNGDGSMYADAGEIVQLYPTIRTMWGPADSVEIWLEFQEFEDTTTLNILQNHVQLGHPISSYSKAKSANPITIQVDSNVVDGRHISLTMCATAPNCVDTLKHDFVLDVTNAVKLFGMLTHNDTLWPNVHYIITDNLAIAQGVTLVIMPGTKIKIIEDINENGGIILSNAGRIYACGTPDSMIIFTKTDFGGLWSQFATNESDTFRYCKFEYSRYWAYYHGGGYFSNCVFQNGWYFNAFNSYLYRCNINDCYFYGNIILDHLSSHLNIVNNKAVGSNNCLLHNLQLLQNDFSYVNVEHPIVCSNIFSQKGCYSINSVDILPHVYTNNTIYWGTSNPQIVKNREVVDFDTPNSGVFGYLDLTNMRTKPDSLAHGIVWKVEVNGYDSQDEFDSIVPLGVGTHEFKVYFNRAMDTAIVPMVAMGVRPPYTQTAIGENASWNADSTIYTCYVTLTGKSAIDGLNRIYVANAQDNEHFEIPYENQRFNVYVASSGSLSTGFQATAGIGKVDLEWNNQEINYDDFLGFNMYRFQYDSLLTNYHYDSEVGQYVYDTIWGPTDTIMLNTTLIQDTVFTDFDVIPGERYYYFYKIMNTSLSENSPSKIVTCIPNSSIPGDANGSYQVDIADVITTINFVTGQDPKPFLFEAADVNGDGQINVLDIVGIINIILNPDQNNSKGTYEQQTAVYTIENGILYINTPVELSGLQFKIDSCTYNDVQLLEAMNGFEIVHQDNTDGSLTVLAYSMSNFQVPIGKTALMLIGDKKINDIILSDPEGNNVIAINGSLSGITDIETLPAQFVKAYPNPFVNEVNIEFVIGQENTNSTLIFRDMLGRQVDMAKINTSEAGKYTYKWNADNLKHGVYFVTLYVDEIKAHTIKLILK